MRFSDWLIGKESRARQSNSDVPHSGYFEKLRVCAFRVACVFLSLQCTAPSSPDSDSKLNKSSVHLSLFAARVQTLSRDVAIITLRLCGRSGAGQ